MVKKKMKSFSLKKYNWGKLSLELIVVFLGVTAGFLLNNWRMNSLNKQTEDSYLLSFRQEMELNILELEKNIKMDSLWLNRADTLIKIFNTKRIPIDSAEVAVNLAVTFHRISLNTSTYENITNSGNLNIINNYRLKEKIVDYYTSINSVNKYDDYFFSFYNDFTLPFVLSDYSILKGEFINQKINDPIKFSNVFSLSYVMIQNRQAAYKELLSKSNSLLAMLQ